MSRYWSPQVAHRSEHTLLHLHLQLVDVSCQKKLKSMKSGQNWASYECFNWIAHNLPIPWLFGLYKGLFWKALVRESKTVSIFKDSEVLRYLYPTNMHTKIKSFYQCNVTFFVICQWLDQPSPWKMPCAVRACWTQVHNGWELSNLWLSLGADSDHHG